MTTSIDILHVRSTWGRQDWLVPEEFGPDGWRMVNRAGDSSIIVSCADIDGAEWVHASIARAAELPSYDDLVTLHKSVWKGRGYAYQCFVPPTEHVNIHPHALHLWGRLDGAPVLPQFGIEGTI